MDIRKHRDGIIHGSTLAIHLNEKILKEADLVSIISIAENKDMSMKSLALRKSLVIAIGAYEGSDRGRVCKVAMRQQLIRASARHPWHQQCALNPKP